eukprot:9487247-Pyramimonas_sp.AAC.1
MQDLTAKSPARITLCQEHRMRATEWLERASAWCARQGWNGHFYFGPRRGRGLFALWRARPRRRFPRHA